MVNGCVPCRRIPRKVSAAQRFAQPFILRINVEMVAMNNLGNATRHPDAFAGAGARRSLFVRVRRTCGSPWIFGAAILAGLTLPALSAGGSSGSPGFAMQSVKTNPRMATSASSTSSMPCVVFRDGFESAPDWLFRDGFELASSTPADAGPPIEFVTSGGYTIRVNLDNVTITDALGLNKLVHSGYQNEYLNGKHIKDWGGDPAWNDDRRSLILGDATKVTLVAQGHPDTIMRTSIYDGDENLQIDNRCNAITHRSIESSDTHQRERTQYDGEVATFETDPTLGTSTYANAYDENRNFQILNINLPLGTTGGYANPHQVTDYYDDPRRVDT